jgi:hypothetical protein
MIKGYNDDILKLLEIANCILIVDFTEKEVLEFRSQMEHDKTLGPDDGFRVIPTFLGRYKISFNGYVCTITVLTVDFFKLNFCVITLLPKKEDTSMIQQYRQFCLLDVSFNKILSWN